MNEVTDNVETETSMISAEAPVVDERPEWLPEKFKSPEDLVSSYSALETKLGKGQDEIRETVKQEMLAESVKDRPTSSHEYIFLFSKNTQYYYDYESVKEKVIDGLSKDYEYRNKRDVWNVRVASYPGAHFATFPKELIIPCIKAGSPKGGLVHDPFMGSGTVAEAAQSYGRSYTGVELNPEYHKIIHNRTKQQELFA